VAGQRQKYASDRGNEYRTNTPPPLNGSTILAKYHFILEGLVHHPLRCSPQYTAAAAIFGGSQLSVKVSLLQIYEGELNCIAGKSGLDPPALSG
jgi:hypothetical protein